MKTIEEFFKNRLSFTSKWSNVCEIVGIDVRNYFFCF